MYSDYQQYSFIALVLGVYLLAQLNLDRHDSRARTLMLGVSLCLALRYMIWRIEATVLPYSGPIAQELWIWTVLAVELAIILEVAVFFAIMSRHNSNATRADSIEAGAQAAGFWPSVDVFIPTYNEGIDVLEKTIVGACNIDYPRFQVHVLDDGRRDWLRDFCRRVGVNYITRSDNRHAKAGNLNNALQQASGDFIAIFDADFVPAREFIRRTIGFFRDPRVGIVQTPQHFYNKDPVQLNLGIDNDWPNEQRLFFDHMADSRDAWDAAFCCGSCSMTRRSALDAIGGFPTESITEDILTTLAMLRAGYVTRYLNEQLAMGLAAESIEGFFVQRERWARGGIQTLFLKDGPLRAPGLTLVQRLFFLPLSWIVQYPARIFLLIVPIIYLWLDLVPLVFTSLDDILFYQAPVLLSYFLVMRWLMPRHYLPILSTAQSYFAAFRLFPTILGSVIKPFGTPFRVTPKGALNARGVSFEPFTFGCIFLANTALFLGVLVNMVPEFQILETKAFFPVAAFWSFVNIVILFVASLMCFDIPRKRSEERFATTETATISNYGATQLIDISVGGCRARDPGIPAGVREVELRLAEVDALLRAKVVRSGPDWIGLRFEIDEPVRHALIRKLFSGRYSNSIVMTSERSLLRGLWSRIASDGVAAHA